MRFGLARVRVRAFRSIRDARFAPGSLCALVGEANAGKSNLLAAIVAGLGAESSAEEQGAEIELEPHGAELPPVVFLPAELRTGPVTAPSLDRRTARAARILRQAVEEQVAPHERASGGAPALAIVRGLETCCASGVRGVLLLIEEPELYLRPHAQRYLYRLLRTFAAGGNQVIYSTHAPAFLDVARLDELALVVRDGGAGTEVLQPEPLPATKEFRALSEFDSERSELFLARAALLVEGRTEKLAFPYVFEALGRDPDREAISIVECGGKGNLPLFIRICRATGIPYVVVHDRDAEPGRQPIPAEQERNELIAALAGPERTVVLEPDFEGVAGLHGDDRKPARALERFAAPGEGVPEPLSRAAELVLSFARG